MVRLRLAAVLWLWASSAAAAVVSIEPPLGPEGEASIANSADAKSSSEGVEHCWAVLRETAVKAGGHVTRTLITSNPELGVVFRADFTSGSNPPVTGRFVCPMSSRGAVVISFELDTPPLASGSWGAVTPYK